MWSWPPGIFTVTGLFANPSRTAALAAAQEEDPEAWVSPAPRSQIRMESSLGPVGTASWTLVRFGKREWFSNAGPNFRRSSRDQDCPAGLKTTQWGLPTLTPVKVRDWPAASMGCSTSSLVVRVQGSEAGWNVARPISTVTVLASPCWSTCSEIVTSPPLVSTVKCVFFVLPVAWR